MGSNPYLEAKNTHTPKGVCANFCMMEGFDLHFHSCGMKIIVLLPSSRQQAALIRAAFSLVQIPFPSPPTKKAARRQLFVGGDGGI